MKHPCFLYFTIVVFPNCLLTWVYSIQLLIQLLLLTFVSCFLVFKCSFISGCPKLHSLSHRKCIYVYIVQCWNKKTGTAILKSTQFSCCGVGLSCDLGIFYDNLRCNTDRPLISAQESVFCFTSNIEVALTVVKSDEGRDVHTPFRILSSLELIY